MDPVTAFGLVAGIIQFIDFSRTLIESAVEVHNSVTGTTADNADMLVTIGRLEEVSGELRAPASSNPEYQALCKLCANCQTLAKELLFILRSLSDKGGSKRQSVGVAFKTWRERDKVSSIRTRLNEYRSQILVELALLLR
jgi:hypothetical protein